MFRADNRGFYFWILRTGGQNNQQIYHHSVIFLFNFFIIDILQEIDTSDVLEKWDGKFLSTTLIHPPANQPAMCSLILLPIVTSIG